MKFYTVTFRLLGPLADAAAVEWTNHPAPVDGGGGWHPCLRQADGSWRFSSRDLTRADQPHRRAPGRFGDLAIRYRLTPAGPWSPASETRKEIVIVATETFDAAALDTTAIVLVPALVAAPTLLGAGKVGAEVSLDPGLWNGAPAPILAFQWLRDGAPIPGAVARAYVPAPEDDLTSLSARVTALNVAGETTAATSALAVTYAAPRLVEPLAEEVFDQGVGPQRVETALAFEGENLTYAAPGAVIDPRTGVLTIPTDQAVSGAVVTVTASNSGGSVSTQIAYTVEAESRPPVLAPQQWSFTTAWQPSGQTNNYTVDEIVLGVDADVVVWSTAAVVDDGMVLEISEPCVPVAGKARTWRPVMRADKPQRPARQFMDFNPTLYPGDATRKDNFRIAYRIAGGSLYSSFSAPKPAEAPKVPARVQRPAQGRWDAWMLQPPEFQGAAKADYPDHYPHGRYGSSYSGQLPISMHAAQDGDLYLVGDSHGVRKARDFGREWYYPALRNGQHSSGAGVCTDPDDPAIAVMALCNGYWSTDAFPGQIYRSADRGETVVKVADLPHTFRDVRNAQEAVACFPPIPGRAGWSGGNRRYYVWSASQQSIFGQRRGPDYAILYRSTDGGRTFQPWKDYNVGGNAASQQASWMFQRQAFKLVTHPTDENTLYICTADGLFRTQNLTAAAGATAWTRVAGGLPVANIQNFWIDPVDPRRMLASSNADGAAVRGLWSSIDGGANWTRVFVPERADVSVNGWDVGPIRNGRRTIVIGLDRQEMSGAGAPLSEQAPWVQDWLVGNGSPAHPGSTLTPAGTGVGHWRRATVDRTNTPTGEGSFMGMWQIAGRAQQQIKVNPARPDEWVTVSVSPWVSSDNGRTWYPRPTGYHSAQLRGGSLADSPSNPGLAAWGAVDKGVWRFTNWGVNVENVWLGSADDQHWRAAASKGVPEANRLVIVPNHPNVPSAKRGRIIYSAGTGDGGPSAIAYVNLSQSTPTYLGRLAEGAGGLSTVYVYGAAVDPNDPNRVYFGHLVSTDAGDTWSPIGQSHRFLDVSQQPARVGQGRRTRIFGYTGGHPADVRFSDDGGATWNPWVSSSRNLVTWYKSNIAQFAINPFDDRVAIMRAENSPETTVRIVLREENGSFPSGANRSLDVPAGYPALAAGDAGGRYAALRSVSWDRVVEGRAYVTTHAVAGRHAFRLDFPRSGGVVNWAGAPSWTDISEGLPLYGSIYPLHNGEVAFAAWCSGVYVRQPEGGLPGGSKGFWEGCAAPLA